VIVTVTPNPSIDRTLEVPAVRRGEVIRVRSATSEAGGKGINVSRALATMGVATSAIAPGSAATKARLDDLLGGSIVLRTVDIDGDIRTNLSLVEPDGTVTKVNEPGPTLDEATAARLLDDIVAAALEILAADGAGPGLGRVPAEGPSERWVVASGSLPPGLPDRFYAELAARMPDDVRVAVDADRSVLRAVVGRRVALLKPNHVELEELMGRSLATLGDVADAAAELVASGADTVLVSLGSDGALVADRDGACHAEASIDDVANPVGAGDALLAGFVAAGARRSGLPSAIAWSVAACRASGTRMPRVTPRDEAAVVLRPAVDRDRRLAG
jgi:1-phosphofructokinase family hexose kinase